MRVNDSSDIFLIGKYQRFVNIRKEIVYAVFRIENRGVPATVIKVTVCSARSITAYLCGNDRYRQRNSRYRTEAVGLVPEPYNAARNVAAYFIMLSQKRLNPRFVTTSNIM